MIATQHTIVRRRPWRLAIGLAIALLAALAGLRGAAPTKRERWSASRPPTGWAALWAYGIRTIVDLRHADERAAGVAP